MRGGIVPDLTWCDPSAADFYTVIGGVALAGIFVGAVIGLVSRSRDRGCLGFSFLALATSLLTGFLGMNIADSLVPNLDICGTTDRHLLPISVGLALLPATILGLMLSAFRRTK